MNVFRVIGDQLHLVAIVLLLLKIFISRSCSGLSGKSQLLLALVYTTRYIDLFTKSISAYNTSYKIAFIVASYIICYTVYIKYKDSYDYKYDTFPFAFLLLPTGIAGIFFNYYKEPMEMLWAFSIYLEAVALLPQFHMSRKMNTKDRTILLYLFTLFLYRSFYVINWINRYYSERNYDIISILGGTMQVVLHWEFLYAYLKNVALLCEDFTVFVTLVLSTGSIKHAILAYRGLKEPPAIVYTISGKPEDDTAKIEIV